MKLPFTGEVIRSPDGREYEVLDAEKTDFSAAIPARKITEILVRKAMGGEHVHTRNSSGYLEESYVAKPGDAIFIYRNDNRKTYVPADRDGTRWKFGEILHRGYLIVDGCLSRNDVIVSNSRTFRILHEAVEEDICIRNPFGTGVNQFLHPRATLLLHPDGSVRGLEKCVFDEEWEILPSAVAAVWKSAAGK